MGQTSLDSASSAETAATAAAEDRAAAAAAQRGALRRWWALANFLNEVAEAEAPALAEVVCAWLERAGAGMPDHDPFGEVRADAAYWADVATPAELEAYTAAGLARIERTGFAVGARKRLILALWQSLPERDRREFVRRVDPRGRFHRGAA